MKLRLLALALIALLVMAAATLFGFSHILGAKGPLAAPTMVVVEPGQGPRTIANRLAQAQVIAHPHAFVLAVRVLGKAGRLQAGEYPFEAGVNLRTVIEKLTLGQTQSRSVTIPEGFTVAQVLARLEAESTLSGAIEKRPAEGMVFPDTYTFRFGAKRPEILKTMTQRMEKELAEIWAGRDVSVPLKTPEELLILASIVQKEAATEAEMPQIAGVFINRLNKGMKLQSDPTVIYGAEFDGDIKRKDLKEPHPFNTYVFEGLPPTPIANPGRAALLAVAHPATTPALFFVADPSRTHHVFTNTYKEHQQAVKRYWQAQ